MSAHVRPERSSPVWMAGSSTSRMYLSDMMPPCGMATSATSPVTRAMPGPTMASPTFGRSNSMGPALKFGVMSV